MTNDRERNLARKAAWSPVDRALWEIFLVVLALILGAFLQATIREYFWFLVVCLIAFAAKPIYAYWRYRERQTGTKQQV